MPAQDTVDIGLDSPVLHSKVMFVKPEFRKWRDCSWRWTKSGRSEGNRMQDIRKYNVIFFVSRFYSNKACKWSSTRCSDCISPIFKMCHTAVSVIKIWSVIKWKKELENSVILAFLNRTYDSKTGIYQNWCLILKIFLKMNLNPSLTSDFSEYPHSLIS